MDIQKINEYIQKVKWVEAKTYAKTHPHEYTIRYWRKDLDEEFVEFALFIREHGNEEAFYKAKFIYYYHEDGYKYWTMGDPMETTWVLNRVEY